MTQAQQNFDAQMTLIENQYKQDWPAIVSQAAKQLQEEIPGTDMGNLMGIPAGMVGIAAMIATIPAQGIAQSALTGISGIGFFAFMPLWVGLSDRKVDLPRWARRAKTPKTKTLLADIEVKDDASVFAVVRCSDCTETKVLLGVNDQEEIAQRFLQVKAVCEQITQHNKNTRTKQLFADCGLKPNGVLAKEKPALPTAQEQEHQMLLTANQELAKALKNA